MSFSSRIYRYRPDKSDINYSINDMSVGANAVHTWAHLNVVPEKNKVYLLCTAQSVKRRGCNALKLCSVLWTYSLKNGLSFERSYHYSLALLFYFPWSFNCGCPSSFSHRGFSCQGKRDHPWWATLWPNLTFSRPARPVLEEKQQTWFVSRNTLSQHQTV